MKLPNNPMMMILIHKKPRKIKKKHQKYKPKKTQKLHQKLQNEPMNTRGGKLNLRPQPKVLGYIAVLETIFRQNPSFFLFSLLVLFSHCSVAAFTNKYGRLKKRIHNETNYKQTVEEHKV